MHACSIAEQRRAITKRHIESARRSTLSTCLKRIVMNHHRLKAEVQADKPLEAQGNPGARVLWHPLQHPQVWMPAPHES